MDKQPWLKTHRRGFIITSIIITLFYIHNYLDTEYASIETKIIVTILLCLSIYTTWKYSDIKEETEVEIEYEPVAEEKSSPFSILEKK